MRFSIFKEYLIFLVKVNVCKKDIKYKDGDGLLEGVWVSFGFWVEGCYIC